MACVYRGNYKSSFLICLYIRKGDALPQRDDGATSLFCRVASEVGAGDRGPRVD